MADTQCHILFNLFFFFNSANNELRWKKNGYTVITLEWNPQVYTLCFNNNKEQKIWESYRSTLYSLAHNIKHDESVHNATHLNCSINLLFISMSIIIQWFTPFAAIRWYFSQFSIWFSTIKGIRLFCMKWKIVRILPHIKFVEPQKGKTPKTLSSNGYAIKNHWTVLTYSFHQRAIISNRTITPTLF